LPCYADHAPSRDLTRAQRERPGDGGRPLEWAGQTAAAGADLNAGGVSSGQGYSLALADRPDQLVLFYMARAGHRVRWRQRADGQIQVHSGFSSSRRSSGLFEVAVGCGHVHRPRHMAVSFRLVQHRGFDQPEQGIQPVLLFRNRSKKHGNYDMC